VGYDPPVYSTKPATPTNPATNNPHTPVTKSNLPAPLAFPVGDCAAPDTVPEEPELSRLVALDDAVFALVEEAAGFPDGLEEVESGGREPDIEGEPSMPVAFAPEGDAMADGTVMPAPLQVLANDANAMLTSLPEHVDWITFSTSLAFLHMAGMSAGLGWELRAPSRHAGGVVDD